MRKWIMRGLIGSMLFCLAAIFVLPAWYDMPDMRLPIREPMYWDSGWQALTTDAKGEEEYVQGTAEGVNPVDALGALVLVNTLPENFEEGQVLMLRTKRQVVRAYLDGELIYQKGGGGHMGRSLGSFWNLIELAGGRKGMELRLEITTDTPAFQGMVDGIWLGHPGLCLLLIIRQGAFRFLTGCVLVLMSFILLLLHRRRDLLRRGDYRFHYLSIFVLLVGLWMLGESTLLELFFSNAMIITSMVYISLLLLPIPLLAFEDLTLQSQRKNYFLHLIWANMGVFFLSMVLVLGGWYDFSDVLWLNHGLILISGFYLLWVIFREAFRFRNREASQQLVSVVILVVAAAGEMLHYYILAQRQQVAGVLGIGIPLFVLVISRTAFQDLRRVVTLREERNYYKDLSMKDWLTGGQNRTAFEQELQERQGQPLFILVIDMNYLKLINDNYGHGCGDIAIRDAYQTIQSAIGHLGNCYRVGGDEFVCLLPFGDKENVEAAVEAIYRSAKEADKKYEFPFSLSVGYARYSADGVEDVHSALRRADERMYEHKQAQHKEIEAQRAAGQKQH